MEIRLYQVSGTALNRVVVSNERISALIPCYNEARTIGKLVRAVSAQVPHIWVIDDGSSDSTRQEAERAGAVVLRHEANLGKGASLRDGFNALIAAGFDWAVTLDGDGQHDPAEIPAFFSTPADLVIGNRMAQAPSMQTTRRFVNQWTSERISKRIGISAPDSQSGFRLVRLAAFKSVHLIENRFAFESEMIVAFARAGFKIGFVPIRCLRARRPSRIHPVADTFRWFRWWLRT
jgi:glycosyltransferase involved in cell wall biosynthesis